MLSDPALILFLNGDKNVAWAVNENFGRELQELFTLGANNGYTQSDVHNVARALTGWQYVDGPGGETDMENFHIDTKCHDWTNKTIYGQTGNLDWSDVARMVVHHPDHPSFFVTKLWSYFISTPPSSSDLTALAELYASSGFQIRPVVEAILCHPDFYNDVNMVKPPAVYVVGMLRARQIFVDGETWQWNCTISGQTDLLPARRRRLELQRVAQLQHDAGPLADRLSASPRATRTNGEHWASYNADRERARRAHGGARVLEQPVAAAGDADRAAELRQRLRPLNAGPGLAGPAPERAAPPDRRLPRLPGVLNMPKDRTAPTAPTTRARSSSPRASPRPAAACPRSRWACPRRPAAACRAAPS